MMVCIARLFLLSAVFNLAVSGRDLHCRLTSNLGNDSSIAVADLHETLVLTCLTTERNGSDLTYEWKKGPYFPLKDNLSILHRTDVAWNDAGRYKCVVKDGVGEQIESCDILVKIKTLPHVEIGRVDKLQGEMQLRCNVKGYFKPDKVIWYKNDQQIFPNGTNYSVINQTGRQEGVFESLLWKSFPNFHDSGNYSCEATNVYGTSRGYKYVSREKIRVDFGPKKCPEFRNNSTEINITISLGSSTTLLCEVLYEPYDYEAGPLFVIIKIVNNTIQDIGDKKNKSSYKPSPNDRGILLINYTIVNVTKKDSGKYRCIFMNPDKTHCPTGNLQKTFNVKVLVLVSTQPQIDDEKQPNLRVVITVSVSGALVGLGLVLYVCHLRKKLKLQFYDSCPDYLPELRWDVFVSYSSHDFTWVDELCQMLEKPPFNLTVCLHQRDWELGRSVVDNMVDSVYCSHKTLIIVSKHYVESEYCMQELQIAMHSEIASELVRKDRIILIKIDDVSMRRLPRVLRQKSYLDCSDSEHAKHFKTNLLRALPTRERLEEEQREEPGDRRSSDESSSSGEIRLQELHVV